jgi:hypothetical protein
VISLKKEDSSAQVEYHLPHGSTLRRLAANDDELKAQAVALRTKLRNKIGRGKGGTVQGVSVLCQKGLHKRCMSLTCECECEHIEE